MVLILIAHGMNGNSNNANVFTVMTPGNSKLVRCQRKSLNKNEERARLKRDLDCDYCYNFNYFSIHRRRDLLNNLTTKNCDNIEKFKKLKTILV